MKRSPRLALPWAQSRGGEEQAILADEFRNFSLEMGEIISQTMEARQSMRGHLNQIRNRSRRPRSRRCPGALSQAPRGVRERLR
jgi:hypothetical protein